MKDGVIEFANVKLNYLPLDWDSFFGLLYLQVVLHWYLFYFHILWFSYLFQEKQILGISEDDSMDCNPGG